MGGRVGWGAEQDGGQSRMGDRAGWGTEQGGGQSRMGDRAGFLLGIYFQMVHSAIGRYETPSFHTVVELLRGKPG